MAVEYVTITEKIERRTYLKGRLTAKFMGALDQPKSDLKIENFYDIEILEAKIFARRADFRPWHEGSEHEEFIPIDKFTTALPSPIRCEVEDENDDCKYYNLHLFSPKIIEYKIYKQLYEKEHLFAVIEGEISGYLRHYDTEERQIEIIKPKPKLPELKPDYDQISDYSLSTSNSPVSPVHKTSSVPSDSVAWGGFNQNIPPNYRTPPNQGCAPQLGCSVLPGGCFSLIVIVVIAYLAFGAGILLFSMLTNLFTTVAAINFPFILSIILPLFIVGSAVYIFVQLQNQLSVFWRWFIRFVIIILIFFLWNN